MAIVCPPAWAPSPGEPRALQPPTPAGGAGPPSRHDHVSHVPGWPDTAAWPANPTGWHNNNTIFLYANGLTEVEKKRLSFFFFYFS